MFSSMKTATKIFLGFLFCIVVSLVIGIAGYTGLSTAQQGVSEVGKTLLPGVLAASEMSLGQVRVSYALQVLNNRRTTDPHERAKVRGLIAEGKKLAAKGRTLYEPLPKTPEEERVWREAAPLLSDWERAVTAAEEVTLEKDRLLVQGLAGEDPKVKDVDDQIQQRFQVVRDLRTTMEKHMDTIVELNARGTERAMKDVEASASKGMTTMLVVFICGAGVALVLGVLVSRSIAEALRRLASEARRLAEAAVAGQLGQRGEVSVVTPEFQPIIVGMNETLDAVISPLNVAAHYVDQISKGAIPPRIVDAYNGDFNTIKNNLNRCIDAVNRMVEDAGVLAKAAVEGRLATRADAKRHDGDFRRIVQGVNETLDAVINPVLEATRVLELLSQYDMTARMEGEYQGDHARIRDALNATGKALHDALCQVADAVEQVSEASKQIACSSQSVAQGASEQASSLEETSSSLEEMSSMTKQNADNTVQARTLSQATKEAAEKGGQAMVRMTDAMEKIRAASEGTAQIIKDINEIAFQTNLLALNAAVEAARAGDAGRGFAVVAEEVRNLALRSKEAAKKTEDLIKQAVSHAENGRSITNEAAATLGDIVGAASKVNDIVSEIAQASQEQSRGIDQVNTAVAEMDKVVQVAAANAEESSSAAEELASQSEDLASLVARFTLTRTQGRRAERTELLTRGRGQSVTPVRRAGAVQRRALAVPVSPVAAGAGTRKRSAEEVIPLASDPDFQDF